MVMTYILDRINQLGTPASVATAAGILGVGAYGSVVLYNKYTNWLADSNKDPVLKSLQSTIDCINNFNSKLANPEQPDVTKMIGSGKAKLVYTGFKRTEDQTGQSIDSRIEDIAYIIPRNSSGQSELQSEILEGRSIKNGVYLANLQLFLESLGENTDEAKTSAVILMTQFPTIEDLIQGLEKKDHRLNLIFEKQSSIPVDLYKNSLQRLMESSLHLAVDLTDAPDILIEGKPAVIARMAQTNLESAVRTAPYPFPQSANLARQLMKGFRELHAGGYVHGDIKLENILVYNFDGNPIIKIADWGKSKKLGDNEVALHTGNRRHMAPERLCSQKGEVFGVAMMVVRMLEEEFLTDSSKQMLTEPDQKDPSKEKRLQDEDDAAKCRKGIERFLSISQGCPEIDTNGLDALHHAFASFVSLIRKKPTNIDSQLGKYIYALQTRLEGKYGDSEEKLVGIRNLTALLRAMLRSDKNERISMEEAVPRLDECLAPFSEVGLNY